MYFNFSTDITKTALVAVTHGSEEIETVSVIDILRRAGVEVTIGKVDKLKYNLKSYLQCVLSWKVSIVSYTLYIL